MTRQQRTAIAVAAREEQEGDDVERLVADWRGERMSDEGRSAGGGEGTCAAAAAAAQRWMHSRASVRILGDEWEGERRERCAGGVVVRRQPCCCAPAKKEDPHGLAPAGASSAQAGGVPACLARASAEIASARIGAAGPALLTPRLLLHLSSSLSCTSNARAAPETVLMADSQSVLQSEQFAAR
jgi:hypothetical protein